MMAFAKDSQLTFVRGRLRGSGDVAGKVPAGLYLVVNSCSSCPNKFSCRLDSSGTS